MPNALPPGATGVLALADGTILPGIGVGAEGEALGEVCFNTAMTGYQEILTDPSYMAQLVTFTFPHVGNVGVNREDTEQFGREGHVALVAGHERRGEPAVVEHLGVLLGQVPGHVHPAGGAHQLDVRALRPALAVEQFERRPQRAGRRADRGRDEGQSADRLERDVVAARGGDDVGALDHGRARERED